LNEIGVLRRREIEARLLAPLIEALSAEIDRPRVLEIVRQTVVEIARRQGAELASAVRGDSLEHFAASLADWQKDDAMQIEVLEQNSRRFAFNVQRCRYAEMYTALGVPELGTLLSCSRDLSLIQGFNPRMRLTRTQTIMEGASFCDFRFELERETAMKTLLVMRHAKSSWDDTDIPDHDRPLNKRGKKDAPRMGGVLKQQGLLPDLILSSTAKRARSTVELLGEGSGYNADVHWVDSLYAAEPGAYIEALRQVPDEMELVMVVGHNPGLEELVAMLTDEWAGLPTAALAEISLNIPAWSALGYEPQGKLVNVWRPKELPG
jgi:phosphohistidine phosphatase SixA